MYKITMEQIKLNYDDNKANNEYYRKMKDDEKQKWVWAATP